MAILWHAANTGPHVKCKPKNIFHFYLVLQLNDVLQHVNVHFFNDPLHLNRFNVRDPVPDGNFAIQTSGVCCAVAPVPEECQGWKGGYGALLTSKFLLFGHDELDTDVVDVVIDSLQAGHYPEIQ